MHTNTEVEINVKIQTAFLVRSEFFKLNLNLRSR